MNLNAQQLAFCQTCNARDRIIQHGRCVVCCNPPHETTPDAIFDAEIAAGFDQTTDR